MVSTLLFWTFGGYACIPSTDMVHVGETWKMCFLLSGAMATWEREGAVAVWGVVHYITWCFASIPDVFLSFFGFSGGFPLNSLKVVFLFCFPLFLSFLQQTTTLAGDPKIGAPISSPCRQNVVDRLLRRAEGEEKEQMRIARAPDFCFFRVPGAVGECRTAQRAH